MYITLVHKDIQGIPYMTLSRLISLKDNLKEEPTFKLVSKFTRCASMCFKISNNSEVYSDFIRKSKDTPNELDNEWNKIMLDIDWDKLTPMRYPIEVMESLKVIQNDGLDNLTSIILLCSSIGINLDYINKDTDSVKVDRSHPYCTKRMAKYFKNMLVKIPRSEYHRLRSINKWYAIKSGNHFYKNKYLDETLLRNSVS